MNNIKIMFKNFGISIFFLIISTLMISIFSYFNILNGNLLSVFQVIFCFISIIIGSYKQGKCSQKRGYLEGIKIGGIYLILFSAINLFFFRMLHIKNYIYYLLILIISSFGGMIGISRKKNN